MQIIGLNFTNKYYEGEKEGDTHTSLGLTLDSLGPPTVLFLLDDEQNTLFHLCQFFFLRKKLVIHELVSVH